jgi:hypothetical protein
VFSDQHDDRQDGREPRAPLVHPTARRARESDHPVEERRLARIDLVLELQIK